MYVSPQAMAQSNAKPISPPSPPLTTTTPSSSSPSSSHSSNSSSSVPTSAPPSPSSSPSSSTVPTTATTAGGFQTYKNPILGLKIQYPSNWLLRQHPYNATGNSTIATFIPPAQPAPSAASGTGSQAVQDRFIPYVDIFVFDSKGTSLDELVNESINHGSLLNATISQSKPITLNDNSTAHMVEYSIIIADRYLFDRMQVWTESGSKVLVISYTSEPQTYLAYLPVFQQMIQSLEIVNPAGIQSSKAIANNAQQEQKNGNSSTISNSQAINDSNSSTIPWLP